MKRDDLDTQLLLRDRFTSPWLDLPITPAICPRWQDNRPAPPRRLTITVRPRADGHVEIRVGDNGPGIPAAVRDRIFEPFYTTKPTGSGNTGLGLSLSYEIVVQGHGGTLAVESTEGEGTTFVITLPTDSGT